MKRVMVLCLLANLGWTAAATAQSADDVYFSGRKLVPTELESSTLRALANNRPHGQAPRKPVLTAAGSARFIFGAGVPVVICAPLQLCDIELQDGEAIRDVNIGDQTRWMLKVASNGMPPSEVQHILVSPVDVGIRTVLVITTDRRTYRIKLVADSKQFMPSASFAYPDDVLGHRRLPMAAPAPAPRAEPQPQPAAGGALAALSFAYEMEGDSPAWKPVRVYNDGLQTVIELPFAMRQTEAPTLLVVRSEGGVFSDDEVVQVNFRVQGTRYVVDTVFDVADLVAGVGPGQQRVRIRRTR